MAVVLLVLAGAGLGLLLGDGAVPADVGVTEGQSAPGADGPTAAPTAPDGALPPAQAEAHHDLFRAIDEAERAMIDLDRVTPPLGEELDEAALAALATEADEATIRLEDLRDRIATLDQADSDAVDTIRDRYLAHLEDWIDWSRALASDPGLPGRPDAAAPYLEAINFSAETFAAAVDDHLDRARVPADVRDLADEIIDRGFRSGDEGTEI